LPDGPEEDAAAAAVQQQDAAAAAAADAMAHAADRVVREKAAAAVSNIASDPSVDPQTVLGALSSIAVSPGAISSTAQSVLIDAAVATLARMPEVSEEQGASLFKVLANTELAGQSNNAIENGTTTSEGANHTAAETQQSHEEAQARADALARNIKNLHSAMASQLVPGQDPVVHKVGSMTSTVVKHTSSTIIGQHGIGHRTQAQQHGVTIRSLGELSRPAPTSSRRQGNTTAPPVQTSLSISLVTFDMGSVPRATTNASNKLVSGAIFFTILGGDNKEVLLRNMSLHGTIQLAANSTNLPDHFDCVVWNSTKLEAWQERVQRDLRSEAAAGANVTLPFNVTGEWDRNGPGYLAVNHTTPVNGSVRDFMVSCDLGFLGGQFVVLQVDQPPPPPSTSSDASLWIWLAPIIFATFLLCCVLVAYVAMLRDNSRERDEPKTATYSDRKQEEVEMAFTDIGVTEAHGRQEEVLQVEFAQCGPFNLEEAGTTIRDSAAGAGLGLINCCEGRGTTQFESDVQSPNIGREPTLAGLPGASLVNSEDHFHPPRAEQTTIQLNEQTTVASANHAWVQQPSSNSASPSQRDQV